jgi:hypothetical protein
VLAGREDRKESGLQSWDAAKYRRRLRTQAAVELGLETEAVENEGLPLVVGRNLVLVARHILESRNAVAITEHAIHLVADVPPFLLEHRHPRE